MNSEALPVAVSREDVVALAIEGVPSSVECLHPPHAATFRGSSHRALGTRLDTRRTALAGKDGRLLARAAGDHRWARFFATAGLAIVTGAFGAGAIVPGIVVFVHLAVEVALFVSTRIQADYFGAEALATVTRVVMDERHDDIFAFVVTLDY